MLQHINERLITLSLHTVQGTPQKRGGKTVRARSQGGPLGGPQSCDHRCLQLGILLWVCAATDWKDENECHVKMVGEQSVELL